MSQQERHKLIESLEKEMKKVAKDLQFEKAAELRDRILKLKNENES
jgi:excinuclease ABC subunit B